MICQVLMFSTFLYNLNNLSCGASKIPKLNGYIVWYSRYLVLKGFLSRSIIWYENHLITFSQKNYQNDTMVIARYFMSNYMYYPWSWNCSNYSLGGTELNFLSTPRKTMHYVLDRIFFFWLISEKHY